MDIQTEWNSQIFVSKISESLSIWWVPHDPIPIPIPIQIQIQIQWQNIVKHKKWA